MTPTHDTAAALEAAIERYGVFAAGGADANDQRTALHRAITAHVEAEVARQLAAAPDVEAAIATLRRLTYDAAITGVTIGGISETTDRLRAAIAADKARSVDLDAIALAADLIGRHLAPTSDVARGAVTRLEAILAGRSARPTPDEARRLVEALESRAAIAAGHMADYDESELDTARTALLRALGVEA